MNLEFPPGFNKVLLAEAIKGTKMRGESLLQIRNGLKDREKDKRDEQ